METRRDGVEESSKRRWYLSESGKVKWGKKILVFQRESRKADNQVGQLGSNMLPQTEST